MRRHIYDWNTVACDVKHPISLTRSFSFNMLTTQLLWQSLSHSSSSMTTVQTLHSSAVSSPNISVAALHFVCTLYFSILLLWEDGIFDCVNENSCTLLHFSKTSVPFLALLKTMTPLYQVLQVSLSNFQFYGHCKLDSRELSFNGHRIES